MWFDNTFHLVSFKIKILLRVPYTHTYRIGVTEILLGCCVTKKRRPQINLSPHYKVTRTQRTSVG